MLTFTVQDNFPQVQAALDQMREDVAKLALPRAINRTVEQGKSNMSREIRGEFNLSASKVNAALRIIRATYRGGMFSVQAALESPAQRGRSLNLINFAARQTSKGVSFKVKRSGARKTIPGAFIANDGRTVFIRVGKSRLPIKALQTIDVPQMFNTKRINERVVRTMLDKFPEVFEREARYYTDRFNARGAA